jgi:hypothetical protein
MIFRPAAIAVAIAALAGSANFAAARDGCGTGWYVNGGGCVPTAEEQKSRDQRRLDRERRSDRQGERRDDRRVDRTPTDSSRDTNRVDRPRDSDRAPTGSSRDTNRSSDACRPGFRRVDGECVRRERN